MQNNIIAEIDSCGFESFHIGDPPDPRAQKVATQRGISISMHRARLFTTQDFDRFDHIYAMDSSHHQKIMKLARNNSDRLKVDLVLNLICPGQNLSVQDPWYFDLNAFENVYLQLDQVCARIVDNIKADRIRQ